MGGDGDQSADVFSAEEGGRVMPVIHGARKVSCAVNAHNLQEIEFLRRRRKELRAQVERLRARAREGERLAWEYWRRWRDLGGGK